MMRIKKEVIGKLLRQGTKRELIIGLEEDPLRTTSEYFSVLSRMCYGKIMAGRELVWIS
jgi:hypothetical protein